MSGRSRQHSARMGARDIRGASQPAHLNTLVLAPGQGWPLACPETLQMLEHVRSQYAKSFRCLGSQCDQRTVDRHGWTPPRRLCHGAVVRLVQALAKSMEHDPT